MPAHAKFTRRRERRLLALIENGATISEASRALEVSRQTVYRRARADAFFAVELRAARTQTCAPVGEVAPLDWRVTSGVPMRTLQEWMGHKHISTTERYADYAPRATEGEMISAAFARAAPSSTNRVPI